MVSQLNIYHPPTDQTIEEKIGEINKTHLWKEPLKNGPVIVSLLSGRSIFRVYKACMRQH